MRLWRYSGILLIATGLTHNLIGVIAGWDLLLAMVNDGVWNSVQAPVAMGAQHTRAELLWFLMLGFAWMMLGLQFHNDIKAQQKPPAKYWAWLLLFNGLIVAIVLPASGAWLFFPQGFIILFARQTKDLEAIPVEV